MKINYLHLKMYIHNNYIMNIDIISKTRLTHTVLSLARYIYNHNVDWFDKSIRKKIKIVCLNNI